MRCVSCIIHPSFLSLSLPPSQQAQAVTLTVAQAFKVAFEFWQAAKEGTHGRSSSPQKISSLSSCTWLLHPPERSREILEICLAFPVISLTHTVMSSSIPCTAVKSPAKDTWFRLLKATQSWLTSLTVKGISVRRGGQED